MSNYVLGLTMTDIERFCHSDVLERAYKYWKNGQVSQVKIDSAANTIEAIVKGSENYEVFIESKDSEIIGSCDCLAYRKYEGQCKHIIAVLLKIHEIENSEMILETSRNNHNLTITPKDRNTINRVIQLFEKYHHVTEESEPIAGPEFLNTEFICKTSYEFKLGNLLTIEMKVGPNRGYVVRNIREFLEAVISQRSYTFTQNFIYDPQEYAFTAEDKAVIDVLLEIIDNERFYRDSLHSYRMASSNRERCLMIPPFIAERLFVKLADRNVSFDLETEQYTKVQWLKGSPEFDFELNKLASDRFSLKLKGLEDVIFFESYGYLFHQGKMYDVDDVQLKMLIDLDHELPMHSQFIIGSDQIEDVLSNVVPNLKKIGNVVVDESVSDQIINPPLKAKMVIDLAIDRLTAKLEYNYDDIVIDPMQNKKNKKNLNVILIRDIEKENAIMSVIENSSFKWNGSELYIELEEDIYEFLYESVPRLHKLADIYMDKSVKNLMVEERYLPQTYVDMNPSNNLLDVQFNMEGVHDDEVQKILQSVIEKKRYYRLHDGTYIPLTHETFNPIRELFEELNVKKSEIQGKGIHTSAIRSFQVESILNQSTHPIRTGKHLRQLLDDIKHPENLEFQVPETLASILRDYQKFGYQWLKTLAHYRFGGILADDMGLGKTLQSIAFILSEKAKGAGPALIISPASLTYNWRNECKKFAPELKAAVLTGDKEQRKHILEQDLSELDVVITSYPLIRRDIDLYKDKQFQLLILDEAQAIKNHQTLTAQSVRKLQSGKRFALSGTPIENSLDELWSIFQVVLPGLFPGKKAFSQMEHEKISKIARPFILRRMKKDVLTELPDKIETVQVSELSTEQKTLYLAYLQKIQQETKETLKSGGLQQNRMKILAGLTRLRQLCCHPGTFLENYQGSSSKLEQLLEIVNEGLAGGRRILIFSQFTSMLEIIREQFKQLNVSYFYLDGQTPSHMRVKMTEQFNEGEKDVFLVSLKAGGTGLNLTGADTVVLYDLWWNPAVDEQAVDRAYRIGQKNVVQVIRLITEGTIEEKIYELQQKKKELIEQVIQPGETMLSRLSEDEIREILDL